MVSVAASGVPVSMLVVEDEKGTLEVLISTLAMKYPGAALHTAENGAQGLEAFAAHQPDIVITDLNMPDMNGVQMIGEIRALRPGTKFIVLTAASGILASATSAGKVTAVDHCILKPVRLAALFAAIDQCIEEIGAAVR